MAQGGQVSFDEEFVDFAVVVFQEDGCWAVAPLPPHVAADLDLFVAALRQQSSEGPSLGLLGLGDEYFIAVRLLGPDVRLFISERAAAEDDEVAAQVLEQLGLTWDQDSARPATRRSSPTSDSTRSNSGLPASSCSMNDNCD